MSATITVEVVYALPLEQDTTEVVVPSDAPIRLAIERSGVLERHAEIELHAARIGVWGRRAELGQALRDGDRVEIYRPLQADPKEIRRARASARKGGAAR